MPTSLARGPAGRSYDDWRTWMRACQTWGHANGYQYDDWKDALLPAVRSEFLPTARERVRGWTGQVGP
jgi:hypothetical protein